MELRKATFTVADSEVFRKPSVRLKGEADPAIVAKAEELLDKFGSVARLRLACFLDADSLLCPS